MKYIFVTDQLPLAIKTSGKDVDEIIKYFLSEPIMNKPQKYKASTIKILFGDEKTVSKQKELDCFEVPTFMQSISLKTANIENAVYVGFPSLYTDEISEIMTDEMRISIKQSFKKHNYYPLLPKTSELGITSGHINKYYKTRMNNIFNSCVWNDIYLKFNDEPSYKEYKTVNKLFYEQIKEIYNEGDVVIILSHMCWLVPNYLKKHIHKNIFIGLCFQTQIPNLEMFKGLYEPLEILDSILECNYLLMPSIQDRNNLLKICKFFRTVAFVKSLEIDKKESLIQFHDKAAYMGIQRIGTDHERTKNIVFCKKVKDKANLIRSKYINKKIIVALSSSNNAATHTNVILGFGNYLKKYGNDVALVLVEIRNSEFKDFEALHENHRLIECLKIMYNDDKIFIDYYKPINDIEFYSLIAAADVGLLIDERDVKGRFSFDFLLCHKETKASLIVSQFANFAEFFPKEMKVNPKDSVKIANKIKKVLDMDENKKIDMKNTMIDYIMKNSTENYFKNLDKRIQEVNRVQPIVNVSTNTDEIISKYKNSKRSLFLLDYDGTLTSIVDKPEDAKPTSNTYNIILKLSSNQKNDVFVVSGRSYKTIDEWFPEKSIGITAEHGLCMRNKNSSWNIKNDRLDWLKTGKEIMQFFVERTPGSFLEEKATSLTFHYRRSDEKIAKNQAQNLKSSLIKMFCKNKNVSFIEGKCVLELRSSLTNKGTACEELIAMDQYDFIFVAGDDKTDEDMFRVGIDKEHFHSVLVGSQKTNAKYRVGNVKEMLGLLDNINHF